MNRIDRVLSWNMGLNRAASKRPTVSIMLTLLTELIKERDATLIALQEAPDLGALSVALGSAFDVVRTPAAVAIIYNRNVWRCHTSDVSNPRVAVAGLDSVAGTTTLWMLSVHVPVREKSERDRQAFVRDTVVESLRDLRKLEDTRSNIVAGDFNLPPFDPVVMRRNCLGANRSLRWVAQSGQAGVDRPLFNATWGILSDHSGTPGSYYMSHVDNDGPWFAIDQLILSPDLIDPASLRTSVITRIGSTNLCTGGSIGAPNKVVGSDHLPIEVTIRVR